MSLDTTDEAPILYLSKAPIVEAIISIEFSPLPPEAVEDFKLVYEQLSPLYQDQQPLMQSIVQIDPPRGVVSHNTMAGLRFVSGDGQHAVQLRTDAFIFSRLGKYDSWESFRTEARNVWTAFRKAVASLEMKTVGLRYVNKISFPSKDPVERYLRLYPVVPDSPDGGPQEVTGGYLRLQIQLVKPVGQLVAQEVMLPPEEEGVLSLALDNDFRFGILGLKDDQVWSLLDQARHIKNQYFLHFITEELLESYR